MNNSEKIVVFEKYCYKCKHYEKTEIEDPCWGCLDTPTNTYSHRPISFVEEEKNDEKRNDS